MNKNSNGFTFGFAIIMVIVVGAILASAAMALKKPQTENVKREKMKDILAAVQVEVSMDEAPEAFSQYVKERLVLDYNGNVVNTTTGEINPTEKTDAFNVDVKKEFKSIDNPEERNYPLFVCEKDGKTFYVLPLVGKGLWGPIWGYLSLKDDLVTIYGASFDHKTETPGLGAEIKESFFEDQFKGEEIKDETGDFAAIKVVKGNSDPSDKHAVDGITGGTITSVGVQEMVNRTLKVYNTYFSNKQG
ncbi:NADH:ubiquinone reductase (Na(+)-transporting) subunit C [Luteibaculum oceani]|uniref:Na(+)-translocating NADH-quinone reductase subunit C n=1 Tax=Luteibaculum oceani TaxID=1294296 RepID=A0A5C6UYZ2_9FLAO|nr:NADH:ubiquinone reductase (Na(+)-transporting) subunit C [Luteibaculum oceani]